MSEKMPSPMGNGPCSPLEAMRKTHSHREQIAPGVVKASWWHGLDGGRVQCDLCPRFCKLHDGQRGFCFVREARDGQMVLASYGRATGYCIDPIEKKPLNHFYPGSSVLSFGTAGCNLGCKYCQNWDISKAKEDSIMSASVSPRRIAEAAVEAGCASVAFTYNDPIIFAEYAIDCAIECHERGLKTVAVSNGYITPEARTDFFAHMDAMNVDLKGFTEDFYHKLCFAHLEPVLDTLRWLKRETGVWLELTTLLIPGHNDSEQEIDALASWVADNLGLDVPLHFTAFFPAFKMQDTPRTPPETVRRARAQAKAIGLHHVYTGNIRDSEGQSTHCGGCGTRLIGRDGYDILSWGLDGHGACAACGQKLPGRFPAAAGHWGSRRKPVFLATSEGGR